MVYICPYCGKEYSKKSYFAKHMREKHGVEKPFEHLTKPTEPEPFTVKPPDVEEVRKVPVMDQNMDRKKKVGGERKMEEAKYECGNCGFKFNKKYKFCPNCGARFNWEAVEVEE